MSEPRGLGRDKGEGIMGRRVVGHLRRNLVAYVALTFALTSTSYAASTKLLPANSVGTKQVVNRSLLKQDFKRGQLPRGPKGPRGNQGPTGAQGLPGPKGDAGPSGQPILKTSGLVTAAVGAQPTLLTFGPFTIFGRCWDPGGGEVASEMYVSTTAIGSAYWVDVFDNHHALTNFGPNTDVNARGLVGLSGNVESIKGPGMAVLRSPSGTMYRVEFTVGTKTFGAPCMLNAVLLSQT